MRIVPFSIHDADDSRSPQQMAHLQKNQQSHMLQMQREHSDMDMNGNRPQTPSSADNAPSPSKRPRLEGGQPNGQQMGPNGQRQGQGMSGQPNPQMMMPNGISPRGMNPAQFNAFQQGNPGAQKSMPGMPNGLMNPNLMPNQPGMMALPDGQGMYQIEGEFYNANGQMGRPGMQTPNGQQGTHALQDYQMQLMLLEQQNKRRLMMARQEQDSMAREGQPPMPGQQLQPGTSPQGSRSGTSPNPSDQMKRGTPKMPQAGLPGSPNAGDPMAQGRGSPASMNFNGQMGPEMAGPFMNGMRPPSSNPAFSGPPMGQPMPGGAGNRVGSGNWPPGQGPPLGPQQSPVSQPPAGTPQERGAMPPPQAPPGGTKSPQPGAAAPPTPQQSTKAAPKGKKEPKDGGRKVRTSRYSGSNMLTSQRPSKKAAAANATPSSEAEHPPTPTPSTPITPQHPNSFNKGAQNAATTAPQQPTSAPAPQPLVQQPPNQPQQPFNDLSIPDVCLRLPDDFGPLTKQPSAFNLDFSALENPDILENFDFDTFLNTDGDTGGFNLNTDAESFGFDSNIAYPREGVETGANDGL